MRILNRKQFLAIEGEVLFSKYQPCYFENLEIKLCNTGTNDFCTQQVTEIKCGGSSEMFDLLADAEEKQAVLHLDFDCGGRDGCFDDNQLFAVWDLTDVQQLRDRLNDVITSMVHHQQKPTFSPGHLDEYPELSRAQHEEDLARWKAAKNRQ